MTVKSVSDKKFKMLSIIFSILGIVIFLVGVVFLLFEYVPYEWAYGYGENYVYEGIYISYFEYAIIDGIDALLTIIFGSIYMFSSIARMVLSLSKNNRIKAMIIIDIFAILCATTSLIFAFISYFEVYGLMYGILTCVSLGFSVFQLLVIIVYAILKYKQKL